ncbi:MAG: MarR family transcriptional regulator [Clostridia bacterium]
MSDAIKEQLATLNQLYKEQDDLYRAYAVKLGISDAAFWVLYTVCDSERPLSQQDMCDAWYYPKQTINSAISALMKRGHVQLAHAAGAGNRKVVELTDAGKAFCQSAILPFLAAERASFLRLHAEERTTLLALFRKQIGFLRESTEMIPNPDVDKNRT